MAAIRYEGRIPTTLRRWCEAHSDKVQEVSAGGGYATDKGFAYDVLLAPGWADGGDPFGALHTIIEATVGDTLAKLRSVRPCDCDECARRKL